MPFVPANSMPNFMWFWVLILETAAGQTELRLMVLNKQIVSDSNVPMLGNMGSLDLYPQLGVEIFYDTPRFHTDAVEWNLGSSRKTATHAKYTALYQFEGAAVVAALNQF